MEIFIEIGLILAITTLISFFVRLIKQPLIVGYILSGIVVGPYVLNILTSTEYIDLFSKLGIAMLLFIVGLSLKLDIIREVGKASLITGLGQIIFTTIIGYLLMIILGFNQITSLYGAIALTFSSTIIILKLLSDKGDMNKLYGKISIGFLLVQDIVATMIILVVSILGTSSSDENTSLVLTSLLLKGISFFLILFLLQKYVLPRVSKFLASSQESLFLFSITWGLGLAGIFYVFGFSIEIGALAAGIALSSSSFSQEISSRMKPLRDFFILLFFVMLGSQIILTNFAGIIVPAIILSLFVLIGNPIIVVIIMNLLGFKKRIGFLAGLTVAQISEFSLILIALAFSFGHISKEIVSLITLVGIITITGSTYLILYAEKIYPKIKHFVAIFEIKKNNKKEEKGDETNNYDMVIFGYDRVGYDFVNIAKKLNKKYLVVDFNPNSIEKLKKINIPHRFGDAEDVSFLEEIELAKAKSVISTIPDFKTNLSLVSYYRTHNKDGIIIVLSHEIKDTKELYEHGASFVVMPHYLGANIASSMLEKYGLEKNSFDHEKENHLDYLKERQKYTS